MVNINGITPFDYYPDCIDLSDTIFLCENDTLTIPCQKPDACDLLDLSYYIEYVSIIKKCTPLGEYYLLKFNKCIKIIYEADTPEQSVHSAHFTVPFSVVYPPCDCCIKDFFVAIQDIDVCFLDCRQFTVQSVLSLSKITDNCCEQCIGK